jgi:hypothetical protein
LAQIGFNRSISKSYLVESIINYSEFSVYSNKSFSLKYIFYLLVWVIPMRDGVSLTFGIVGPRGTKKKNS